VPGRYPRALIADDLAAHRQLLTAILESQGLEVQAVADGIQAVELAKSVTFNLILMDVSMPLLDGLAATRLIREHEAAAARPRANIVIVTSHGDQADIQRSLDVGADAHVTKPVNLLEIIEAIGASRHPGDAVLSIKWRDGMEIDHGVIDEDHKTLIAIINEFLDPAHDDMTRSSRALDDLRHYASVHFAREEALQQAVLYPESAAHRRQHQALFRQLLAIRGQFEQLTARPAEGASETAAQGPSAASTKAQIGGLLQQWLFNHIIGSDFRMRPFAKAIEAQAGGVGSLALAVAAAERAEVKPANWV
jgi:hemerythrin-like metal-binding protein